MAEKEGKPKAKTGADGKTSAKEPVGKSAKPAAKSAGKPAAETPKTVKPTAKSASKPVAETPKTVKPAAKSAGKPAAETPKTVKPAAKSASKPVAETLKTAKPAAKSASKPAAETPKTVKPAAKSAGKPAAETPKTVKPAAKSAVKESRKDNEPKENNKRGGVLLAVKEHKVRTILIAVISFMCILALILGITLGMRSRNRGSNRGDFTNHYAATTQVGYFADVTGTVKRNKPVAEVKNEGMSEEYPTFGYTLNSVIGADKVAARDALIAESSYLTATGTRNAGGGGYTWMDENGYLYQGTRADEPLQPALDAKTGEHRQLYEHTVAKSMYYQGMKDKNGNVIVPYLSDDEERIVKEITLRPRGYNSYSVTGVYAPAGEVIKIQLSEKDMNATGGLTIHIGQALYNGQSNNIWSAKNQMQRFPNILNTMVVNKNTAELKDGVYTAYVGSFVGGPLYVRNTSETVKVTVSGGVRYSHFILGYTTPEEFAENAKSTAPYFDLEVWNYGVLHSGPKLRAQNFSYDDLYKAAILWEKVSSVTTTNSNQGIVFLYEPFVAAGAAVAFPGRSSVNCPDSWMSNSLNYNAIVSSGAWGNFHEYHHNFQGYGVGGGGEVTNNGMTLVSYSLFTKISSKRGIASYGGQGLGGWNNYTSASWALNDLLNIQRGGSPSNGMQGLALYATLLHNFGPDDYIQAKVRQQKAQYGQSYAGYFRAWVDVTHNDMSYYFSDVLGGLDKATAESLLAQDHPDKKYPMFVPVSSVYQTGRSYTYDGEKRYITTMQPYVIPYGEEFTVDLREYTAPNGQYESGSIVLPSGFMYNVKKVTQPEHGKIEKVSDKVYKFKLDGNLHSGKIIVTLGVERSDKAFKVDDIDLVLEFEQSHETNKMTLERTTYTYSADKMYSDATAAYENGFKGYEKVVESNHANPVQNCNTDIWLYPDTAANRKDHPDAPESFFVHPNTIEVIDGKLYFEDEGKYRIYLRGRVNCAVYYSLDGKNYQLGAKVTNGSGAGFYLNNEDTYFDLELGEHSWVYVREVLIEQATPVVSYIGLGYGKWETPLYRSVEKYYDAKGKEVASPEAEGYHHSEIKYYDANDKEVSEEVVSAAKDTPPKAATYINAYRRTYEFPDNKAFETDYFYTREYSYNYQDNVLQNTEQTLVAEQTKYSSPPAGWGWGSFPITNITDGNRNTLIHTSYAVTESNPLVLTLDMGAVKTVNRMVIYGQYRPNGDWHIAKSFNLYGSLDGQEYTLVQKFTDIPHSGGNVVVNFAPTEMRYYKLEVVASHQTYVIIGEIEMWNVNEVNGGKLLSPDNDSFIYNGDWKVESAQSTFGHAYVGKKGAEMSFKFTGTRLALLSSAELGADYEVTIDGKKVTSIQLKAIDGQTYVSFLSEPLKNKEHKVVIKCKGKASIDSVVVFPEN